MFQSVVSVPRDRIHLGKNSDWQTDSNLGKNAGGRRVQLEKSGKEAGMVAASTLSTAHVEPPGKSA